MLNKVFFFLVVAILFAILVEATGSSAIALWVCLGIAAPFVILQMLRVSRIEKAERRAKEKFKAVADEHLETLARKRLAGVTFDDYGNADTAKWEKEVQYFVDKVVRPMLTEQEALAIAGSLNAVATEYIEEPARVRSGELEENLDFDPGMTPIEYENYCARLLRNKGWDAKATVASGDQGADVTASKNGRSVVIQCKLYTQPVGNKAVQEVVAAKAHTNAGFGAVVTNAEFTRSAKELAQTTGTYLLHHSDLLRLDEILYRGPGAGRAAR